MGMKNFIEWQGITMTNIRGIAHVAIQAQAEKFEELVTFYVEALEFKVVHRWSLPQFNLKSAAMLKSCDGNTLIEIFDSEADIAAQGRKRNIGEEFIRGALLHFAINVMDVSKAYETALSYGATKCIEPSVVELGSADKVLTNALVYSPNGEVIEFINESIF